MNKFLLRLAIVLVPFLVVMGTVTQLAYKSEMAILERDLTCPTNILAAVVGDSRAEVYFDPDEIPWLQNFGQSASPFSITANKARMIAKLNHHFKLLVIDVWPHTFFSRIDVPYNASLKAPAGIALMELYTRKDMPPIGEEFEMRLATGVIKPYFRSLTNKQNAHGEITGKFFKNKKHIDAENFATQGMGRGFGAPKEPKHLPATPTGGEIVLEHLLADLTGQGINVVLTTTPMLWYEQRWDKESREYFERRMQEIADKYNVTWYNWMHEYQDKPEYWADGLHLNDIGAIEFSRAKRPILERHLR